MTAARIRLARSFPVGLAVALLVANVIADPTLAEPGSWPTELAALAPLVLLALASTPAILSGRGGVDISVGPTGVLCNVVLVAWLLPHGIDSAWACVPILLALGAFIGTVNGLLVAYVRLPPVVVTLCTFFVVGGIAANIGETPRSAPDNWTTGLGDTVAGVPGALILIAAPIAVWLALGRGAYLRNLYAVGGNDATAFASGVNVAVVRVIAYALGGLFAAIGGIALTALVQSTQADAVGQYTLIVLAAVALGGIPLGGGRGGLAGAALGAASIYLMQTLLTATDVPATWLQIAYGVLLIVGIVAGAQVEAARGRAVAR
jgi:ribose transport system permease protein